MQIQLINEFLDSPFAAVRTEKQRLWIHLVHRKFQPFLRSISRPDWMLLLFTTRNQMPSRKFWKFRFTRWTERRLIRSMQRQRTARRRRTRRRRFSSAACRRTHPSMRWRLTSVSSARSRKLWCWWTSRPNVTADLDSSVLLTVSWKFFLYWRCLIEYFLEDVVDRICEIHFHTIKNKKVECKKAQPKETVTPATQLQLQKRLLLSGLGLRMPTGMVAAPPGAGVVQQQLSAYNPLAQVRITGISHRVRDFYIQKAYGFQAQAAAGVVPQHMQGNGASAVTGGKLFATYPPSFHALR